jgi:hypothetical protein
VTATENQAKRYINIALHDMHVGQGEKFPWAERRSKLITKPQYAVGTLSVNRGDTTITGSGTDWNSVNEYNVANMVAGGKIVIGGTNNVYEISSVASDTSATLTSDFIGTQKSGSITAFASGINTTVTSAAHGLSDSMTVTITGTTNYDGAYTISSVNTNTFDISAAWVSDDATGTWTTGSVNGESYVYFEDEYALAADFLRPIDQQSFDEGCSIDLVGRTEFRRRYPRNRVPGKPMVGTIIDLGPSGSTAQRPRLRLAPPPSTAEAFPYAYVTANLAVASNGTQATDLSADTDQPIVPLRYRHAIVFHALAHWYRDKKDDARSLEAANEYTQLMLRIISDNEIGSAKPQFRPRVGLYRRRAKRPWGGGGGRYDLNNRFDRLEW